MKRLTQAAVNWPVKVNVTNNPDDGERPATNADALLMLARLWTPQPNQVLTLGELRQLNRAVDALESRNSHGPAIQGSSYIEFQDDDWAILKRVVLWVLPRVQTPMFWRNASVIEDVIEGVK